MTGAPWRLINGYADVYYIPQNLSHYFVTLMDIFIEHKVFMDIAVQSVLGALSSIGKFQTITGNSVTNYYFTISVASLHQQIKQTAFICRRAFVHGFQFMHWASMLVQIRENTDKPFFLKIVWR